MLGIFILKNISVLSLLGAMSIICSTQNSLLARKWVGHARVDRMSTEHTQAGRF